METEAREKERSQVLGMRVISISEGLELGQIKQVVIHPELRVEAFLIRSRRFREERRLPLAAVSSFGRDRVTVESQSLLERGNSFARQGRRLRGPLSLVGCRAFTAGGRVLGRVEEYAFSTTDGSLAWLEIGGGPWQEGLRLPGRFIIALSPQTVMLKEEALAEAIPVAGALRSGISAAVGKVGGAARPLADATRQGAAKLSSGLSRLWEKGQEPLEPEERELRSETTARTKNALAEATEDATEEGAEEASEKTTSAEAALHAQEDEVRETEPTWENREKEYPAEMNGPG